MSGSTKISLLGTTAAFGKNDSPWVSVFNLCNAAIGAGVLSFPYGFRKTGVLGGVVFTTLIWAVEVFALCLLVRVAEKCNSRSYQELVSSVLGSKMALVTSVTMLTFLCGSMISYLIIAGDVFTPVFVDILGVNTIFGSRRVVISLFAFLVILPLSLQTTLKALKYSSMISVVMLTYLTAALVSIGISYLAKQGFPTDILIFEAGVSTFILMDIVVFAFQCHIQVVPIFAELAERPRPFFSRQSNPLEEHILDEEVISDLRVDRRGRSERVRRMDHVILLSMFICLIGYCLVGEFGYLMFPKVESDVLISFGNTNLPMNVARIGMAVVAMVCYPVQHHPARSIVDDAIKYVAKVPEGSFSWARHVLITLTFFSFTLGVALLVEDLGKVFSIVGSTGGVMVVFIIPGILQYLGLDTYATPDESTEASIEAEEVAVLRATTGSKRRACVRVTAGIGIILFGCAIFFATAYVTATGLAPSN